MVMSTRSKALGKRKRQIGNNVRSTLAGLGLVEDEEVQSAKESIASGQDGNSTDLTNDGVVTQNGAKNKRQKYFPELNKQSNHLSGKEPLNSQSSNKSSSVTIPGNNKIKAPVKKGPYVKVPNGGVIDKSTDRYKFEQKLLQLHKDNPSEPLISFRNDIDDTTPDLGFKFITKSIIGKGVHVVSEDFMGGCTCRADNGRHVGCEYTRCECIQNSPEIQTASGLKRHFPYYCTGHRNGCLMGPFLDLRLHIWECNKNCGCRDNCKTRVVQKGRRVALEIFKTTNRGWGLRTLEPLKQGQFIDTYKGEILTSDEADYRDERRKINTSYMYQLDKFAGSKNLPADDNPYVIDSEFYGAAMRFMNHSCEPNCRQYTASTNHADLKVYDVAFFAIDDIAAGTELTFDYLDKDDVDDEQKLEKAAAAAAKYASGKPIANLAVEVPRVAPSTAAAAAATEKEGYRNKARKTCGKARQAGPAVRGGGADQASAKSSQSEASNDITAAAATAATMAEVNGERKGKDRKEEHNGAGPYIPGANLAVANPHASDGAVRATATDAAKLATIHSGGGVTNNKSADGHAKNEDGGDSSMTMKRGSTVAAAAAAATTITGTTATTQGIHEVIIIKDDDGITTGADDKFKVNASDTGGDSKMARANGDAKVNGDNGSGMAKKGKGTVKVEGGDTAAKGKDVARPKKDDDKRKVNGDVVTNGEDDASAPAETQSTTTTTTTTIATSTEKPDKEGNVDKDKGSVEEVIKTRCLCGAKRCRGWIWI